MAGQPPGSLEKEERTKERGHLREAHIQSSC